MSETQLKAFDTNKEKMIAGALGGYAVAGGAGAIAGAYIGNNWD